MYAEYITEIVFALQVRVLENDETDGACRRMLKFYRQAKQMFSQWTRI